MATGQVPGNNTQQAPSANGSSVATKSRQVLGLKPLTFREIPSHPDTSHDQTQAVTLKSFLESILAEAYDFDLENGWTDHGKWQPQSNQGVFKMPSISATGEAQTRDMSMRVDQRAKGTGKSAWLARRSFHEAADVDYTELDSLLAQDHARQEADYTPSVLDANELLKWDAQDLKDVAAELNPQWKVHSIQMAIYQMFHMMPSAAGGLVKLQDRVFHVLVVTAHSLCASEPAEGLQQALTLQLPVDIQSFSHIPAITERSHADGSFKRYKYKEGSIPADASKRKHDGNRLTEGCYVSLERLRKVPAAADIGNSTSSYSTQWDMMTMSDAKGITSIASKKQIMDGTFDAVTKDVYYVMNHVRSNRLEGLDQQKQDHVRKEIGEIKDEMDFTRVKS